MKIKNKNLNRSYAFIYLIFAFLILAVVISIGVFATVNHLTNTIATNYSAGDKIRGNVYLTVVNHSADSVLTSNFPGNITLLDFIKKQSGLSERVNYNCSSVGCANDYYSSGTINGVSLTTGQEKFVGFKLNGPGVSITNAKISVNSNAPLSCSPNLFVDILADGDDIIASTQSSGESCGIRHVGCYDTSNTEEAPIVTGTEYCEKISIPAAPAFKIGGKIHKGDGVANLTMRLYDFDSAVLLGNCTLPQSPAQTLQDLSCVVNYPSSETKNYSVCVTTRVNVNSPDKIGWETNLPTCGTAEGFGSLDSDFDLFAETMKYSASPSFVINNTLYDRMFMRSLSDDIDNYVDDHYGGSCQSNPCFIPIKFYGEDQVVGLSEARVDYTTVGVNGNTQTIHGLTYEPTKIRATNLSLDISKADFIIPVTSSETKFKFYLDGDKLFEKDISVRRSFAFDVNPKVVAFGQNARFRVSNLTNVTSSTWNFGDGTPIQTVNGSEISHSYTKRNSSSFDVNVTVNRQGLQATKQFKIFVGDPRIIANQTIIEYKKRITNITTKINSYPTWIVSKLQSIVDLGNLTSRISAIERNYGLASDESGFQEVMLDLIKLDVPVAVATISSGENFPLSAGYDNVNVNYLEQIENKDITDNSALTEQVIGWMNDKFNPEISFKKIAKVNEFDADVLASMFTIKTNPIGSVSAKTYLIFGQDIEKSGMYKSNYSIKSITGENVDYIVLDTSSSQTFEFIVYGDIDAETLGAYIAPSLSVIGNTTGPSDKCNINDICEDDESADSCPEDCSTRWFKFTIIGWIVLFVLGFVAYIILQEWYKRNYQKNLFPERNDLYNLITFIYNARKSGLSDGEIRSRLHQQGWSSERIRFAFRKIEGKRVAMLEIPLFTRKEHKNTITQISNRQGYPVDTRFIKRPSFN
ncbi:MAG: PKD domain-containing protein [Nanoarchaeota archaeon]